MRKIAEVAASNEEERETIEKQLLIERAKIIVAPEITKSLFSKPIVTTEKGTMPSQFLKRVKNDLAKTENKEFTKSDQKNLDAVISGKKLLSSQSVVHIAKELKQPIDQYLALAGYMPDHLKKLMCHEPTEDMLRSLASLEANDVLKMVTIMNNIIEIYKERR